MHEKLQRVENQISELLQMRDTLQTLVERCPGDEKAQCSIIDSLADGEVSNDSLGEATSKEPH